MKKPILISLIFSLAVVAAILFLLNNKADAPDIREPASANKQESTGSQSNVSTGKYADYSETELASAQGQRVLFFHAPWCPQCRSIEKGILKDGVPGGFSILKVDYDTNQDLREKYGVTLQTTFVKIDEQGNEIEKFVAYDEPTFEAVKRDFL